MPLLETRSVGCALGDVQVLWNASIAVERGEIVCLLGPNGSGKSTLMNGISRLNRLVSGEIWFDGHALHRLPPHKISRLGISHVLERHRLFPYMTVLENLLLGAGPRPDPGGLKDSFARVYELFPRLKERERQIANSMSGGEQQMCAIGRGLMANPKLLMVDEPFIGLSPRYREEVTRALLRLNGEGLAILMIEQNVRQALGFSHRAYVLKAGQIAASGPSAELAGSAELEEIFFGRSRGGAALPPDKPIAGGSP
ncbi:ABC transporter ATP-binding protein [Bradyrhizobium sediminis]|uniref:ABC transporter ATP-binding protein n=1 Tax=Bradyrhizobium sediminis TaxID=2840469 RepID=A0A975RWP2_9BRAD|nr:ABC transporter ATP-binding protein [Bradyrhizobium sediminis]QWG22171.1 ABC transporter ATP-binding protein [Bradyrhizobium sediminis]